MNDLGRSRWPDLAAIASGKPSPVLLIPLGSTEQHGPHLPFDTDTRIAEHLCAEVAASRDDVIAAPALAYGASGEHQGFAGTLSIGTEALHLVLVELCRSATETFDNIVLVNGHGGNVAGVGSAVALLQGESRRVSAWWPRVPDGDAHAGKTETSIMLAIAPESVDSDAGVVGNTEPIETLLPRLRTEGMVGVTPNGVLGDPTAANEIDGAKLVGQLVQQLDDHVASVRDAGPS